MAKRKRLTPARVDLHSAPVEASAPRKSLAAGPRPPIADVAQDASASAALTEIAQTLSDARAQGRLIQPVALDAIQADYLVRDRIAADPDEMQTLIASIRARGQQTAIEVTALDNGKYGLISGWRRLQALRHIANEDPETDTVLAIIRTPQDAAEAYQAMIEENEIRVGLSFFERARIVARAVDAGVFNRDRVALAKLFAAASRPKRSKIGSFVRIVRALEDDLHFPSQLNERNGLTLAQALAADPQAADTVRNALRAKPPKDAAAEARQIAAAIAAPTPSSSPAPTPQAVRDGLTLKETAKGDVILSGPVLQDPAFKVALLAFLSQTDAAEEGVRGAEVRAPVK